MLAVKKHLRGRGIATKLVERAIYSMIDKGANEVCLETEVTNPGAMRLYENLGFLRYNDCSTCKHTFTDKFQNKKVI